MTRPLTPIVHTDGDIWEQGKGQIIVIPVNTEGVAGAGLAEDFRLRFPHAFLRYRDMCDWGEFICSPASLIWTLNDGTALVGAVTKSAWYRRSDFKHVERTVQELRALVRGHPHRQLHVPALGCGLGKLPWTQVRPMMENILSTADVAAVYLYDPK